VLNSLLTRKGVIKVAKDPVCNMEVDEATAPKAEHKGKTYYFCCDPCKDAFDKEPDKYVKEEPGKSCCGG